jgi:hypothetical protein
LFQSFLNEQFKLLPETKQKKIYLSGGDLAKQAGDRVSTLRLYYLSGEWERLLSLPLTSYEIADVVDEHTKSMILDIMVHTPFEIKRKYPAAMVPLAFTCSFSTKIKSFWPCRRKSNRSLNKAICLISKRTRSPEKWNCSFPFWNTTASPPEDQQL